MCGREMIKMNVYVLLADGFEEIEALTPVDILRRAGFDVSMVSIYDRLEVNGGHNILVKADIVIDDIDISKECCVILPGGAVGVTNLKASEKVKNIVKKQNDKGGLIAAICAAPTLLSDLGLLNGKIATCYPDLRCELSCESVPENADVVMDGNIITSSGAGTSGEFAFAICSVLGKDNESKKLRGGMCYPSQGVFEKS